MTDYLLCLLFSGYCLRIIKKKNVTYLIVISLISNKEIVYDNTLLDNRRRFL